MDKILFSYYYDKAFWQNQQITQGDFDEMQKKYKKNSKVAWQHIKNFNIVLGLLLRKIAAMKIKALEIGEEGNKQDAVLVKGNALWSIL